MVWYIVSVHPQTVISLNLNQVFFVLKANQTLTIVLSDQKQYFICNMAFVSVLQIMYFVV